MRTSLRLVLLLVLSAGRTVAAGSVPATVAQAEAAYADALDAAGIVATIESGYATVYAGRTRTEWIARHQVHTAEFERLVARVPAAALTPADARAVEHMRRRLAGLEPGDAGGLQPASRCADTARTSLDYAGLRGALYACFDEVGNAIEFENARLTRVEALSMLAELDDPARRKHLFMAFEPLWQAVNGDNGSRSPYRTVIGMAAQHAAQTGSEIDAAARTLGVGPAEVERWLEQVLDAWRVATDGPILEPWDYRYRAGDADRALRDAIRRSALVAINDRYYADLGVDLRKLGVLYDLEPRPGKAPLAYADFVTRGRTVDGVWQPTVARVSGSYGAGGLGLLNELVHENGHAAHMMALRTRPAYMDLGDALYFEALADVPSWSTYEPAWQRKYVGRDVTEAASLRALYSNVMLDVAWALFEARMLREPESDPNATWTQITSRYLHIRPHPELAWWAVRVQLVDSPGYMVNYGLGAVLTADLRQHVRDALGPFDTGNSRWYAWLSEHLLRYGEEIDTAELLRRFLGRPVTPEALLSELRRIR